MIVETFKKSRSLSVISSKFQDFSGKLLTVLNEMTLLASKKQDRRGA